MRGGVPHRDGLPGQPGRVARLAEVSFLHMEADGWVSRLSGVMSIRAFINMATNRYKLGELFPRFCLQNVEKNIINEENTEEVDGANDNLSVKSDNKAELLRKNTKLHATLMKRISSTTCGRCTQSYADA